MNKVKNKNYFIKPIAFLFTILINIIYFLFGLINTGPSFGSFSSSDSFIFVYEKIMIINFAILYIHICINAHLFEINILIMLILKLYGHVFCLCKIEPLLI